jgi:hypothetical protein
MEKFSGYGKEGWMNKDIAFHHTGWMDEKY